MTKVSITDECIGCGACVALAPDLFEMDSSTMKSIVKKQPSTPEEVALAKDAAEACPVNAIKIK
ncbi:MAG: ferredoxin [Candidatus Altiarchaeota archaeon]|nr:ferredoxin [Candidatus Altiarchaeota archaeon]